MADPKKFKAFQRDEQVLYEAEAHKALLDNALKNVHTALPGIIASYDADTQTASVQPAIKRLFIEKGAVNLPLCVDCPVQFPQGGPFVLTFPVVAGDECLLLFSERAIDFWFENGGVQLPSEYRTHDLSDAFVLVGVNSLARKLTNVQTDGAELRTRDRSIYLKITESGFVVKGDITLDGDINQTGGITSSGDHVANGTHLHTHTHPDPQGGSTGQPS